MNEKRKPVVAVAAAGDYEKGAMKLKSSVLYKLFHKVFR